MAIIKKYFPAIMCRINMNFQNVIGPKKIFVTLTLFCIILHSSEFMYCSRHIKYISLRKLRNKYVLRLFITHAKQLVEYKKNSC